MNVVISTEGSTCYIAWLVNDAPVLWSIPMESIRRLTERLMTLIKQEEGD